MGLNSIGIDPFPKSHSNGRGRERVLFTLAGNEQRKVTKPQGCGRVEGGGGNLSAMLGSETLPENSCAEDLVPITAVIRSKGFGIVRGI